MTEVPQIDDAPDAPDLSDIGTLKSRISGFLRWISQTFVSQLQNMITALNTLTGEIETKHGEIMAYSPTEIRMKAVNATGQVIPKHTIVFCNGDISGVPRMSTNVFSFGGIGITTEDVAIDAETDLLVCGIVKDIAMPLLVSIGTRLFPNSEGGFQGGSPMDSYRYKNIGYVIKTGTSGIAYFYFNSPEIIIPA